MHALLVGVQWDGFEGLVFGSRVRVRGSCWYGLKVWFLVLGLG